MCVCVCVCVFFSCQVSSNTPTDRIPVILFRFSYDVRRICGFFSFLFRSGAHGTGLLTGGLPWPGRSRQDRCPWGFYKLRLYFRVLRRDRGGSPGNHISHGTSPIRPGRCTGSLLEYVRKCVLSAQRILTHPQYQCVLLLAFCFSFSCIFFHFSSIYIYICDILFFFFLRFFGGYRCSRYSRGPRIRNYAIRNNNARLALWFGGR